jgi:hypothetical protein
LNYLRFRGEIDPKILTLRADVMGDLPGKPAGATTDLENACAFRQR